MSADFWASYGSGALGICIGNRLDILKTELQAGNRIFTSPAVHVQDNVLKRFTTLFRGAAAPVLGYGALNSVLFMTFNRSLKFMDPSIFDPTKLAGVDLGNIWLAGAIGGLACWVVSAPTELIKCRTQLNIDGHTSSYATTMHVLRQSGIQGLYLGGTITSMRDSFGYAWYFWSYELSKRMLLSRQIDPFHDPTAFDVLIAGGIAGVVTWASVFPLDVIKTRVQTQSQIVDEATAILHAEDQTSLRRKSSWQIAREIARVEGATGFYRGLGICSLRAFIVNAAQWYLYEEAMKFLTPKLSKNG
ncbi:hypothetical protein LTR05_007180 [Lithohypha guttulata]|uniref:Mitochondrial carrier protein n=1 Tax=Lithohypha guttulata TaxID=1690604 RepID=A0AAN7SUV6_9EURO|nr:hypothetical protein LTR05_007180 [Lithohypha guttulata]